MVWTVYGLRWPGITLDFFPCQMRQSFESIDDMPQLAETPGYALQNNLRPAESSNCGLKQGLWSSSSFSSVTRPTRTGRR